MKKRILSLTLAAALIFAMLTGMAPGARSGFTDVGATHPHRVAITALAGLGIMNGVAENTFAPASPATWGMVFTALDRIDGIGAPTDPWYQGGMDWAQARGLSDGAEEPLVSVTLEQMIVALWGYMKRPHRTAPLDEWYDDAQLLSEEGRAAMCWAVNDGIISNGTNTLNPHAIVDRGQLADAIWRMLRVLELSQSQNNGPASGSPSGNPSGSPSPAP